MIAQFDHEQFRRVCESAERFVLTTHVNPDGDAVGSQTAVARFLHSLGKKVRIVNQDPVPQLLDFIVDPQTPVECYEEELHDAVLRETDWIVLLDNSVPDRLGRMENVVLEQRARTLCIDHHPTRSAPWGRHIYDVEACATAAMVYELTVQQGWTPDLRSAEAIYVGLVTDTGHFRYNSTTVRGHEIAAELLVLGVDPARAFQQVYERNSLAFTRLLGHALAGLRLDGDGAVASVKLSRQLIESVQAEQVDTSEITTALLAIDGVRVALLLRELADGRVKVSLRSKGGLDVHRLASDFGGGGHRNASGIVMQGDLESVLRLVTEKAAALLTKRAV